MSLYELVGRPGSYTYIFTSAFDGEAPDVANHSMFAYVPLLLKLASWGLPAILFTPQVWRIFGPQLRAEYTQLVEYAPHNV